MLSRGCELRHASDSLVVVTSPCAWTEDVEQRLSSMLFAMHEVSHVDGVQALATRHGTVASLSATLRSLSWLPCSALMRVTPKDQVSFATRCIALNMPHSSREIDAAPTPT